MIGKFYEEIGVGVASIQPNEDAPLQPAIGLSFPLPEPVRPDDLNHDDNFEDVLMSVATAKALIIDLQDAVDSVVEQKPFV